MIESCELPNSEEFPPNPEHIPPAIPQPQPPSPILEPEIQISLSNTPQIQEPLMGDQEALQKENIEEKPILEAPAEDICDENRMNLEDPEEIYKELDESQEMPNRSSLSNKKKYSKLNLKTYQDLVSVIRNKSSCEWQESRYSLPSTNF